jgi:dissimilatory sulfite reductase (desulfoviridin) alpha/beta subunit
MSQEILINTDDSPQPTVKKYRDEKMQGFITQRIKGMHALRLRIPCGHINTEDLHNIGKIADKYGKGYIALTMRKGIEIPWIRTEELLNAKKELNNEGIVLAGCGPRMRSVFVCMGDVCPYSSLDVYKLGMEFDKRYFSADNPDIFPHKFKVGITGCTIGCAKPQFNDVGVMGLAKPGIDSEKCTKCGICAEICLEYGSIDDESQAWIIDKSSNKEILRFRDELCIYCGDCIRICPASALYTERSGMALFVGGKFGRHPRLGTRIANFLTEDEVFDITEKIMDWYKKNGKRGERLGTAMDRVGLKRFKEDIFYDGKYSEKVTNFEDKRIRNEINGKHWI